MSFPGWLLIGSNAAVLAIAALVLWLRGRRYLAAFFTTAVALHFTGLIYVVTSKELPGFTSSFSVPYRIFDFLTNFGYLAHSVAVLAICLALSPAQPNNSFKADA